MNVVNGQDWAFAAEQFIIKITCVILLAWTAYELIRKKMGL